MLIGLVATHRVAYALNLFVLDRHLLTISRYRVTLKFQKKGIRTCHDHDMTT